MRMRTKALVFFGSAAIVSLGSTALLMAFLPHHAKALAGVWFLICGIGFAIAQFVVLVCPHCKSLAFITSSGMAVPPLGERCPHCHQPY